jgi:uncharacterized membrane protein HdeD (DUF308 family)
MGHSTLSWRDRILLLNSVLFCVVGIALVARYFTSAAPLMTIILGAVFFTFGAYRLALARKEMQKRARRSS